MCVEREWIIWLIIRMCFSHWPQPLTKPELWHMVLLHYGGDVGLSREDMENVLVSEATR